MKILVTTFGSLGDLFPYLNIARHLVEAGHSITIASNEHHRSRVEQAGHAFHPIRPYIEDGPEFFHRVMDSAKGTEYLLRKILFPAVRDAYQDVMDCVSGHDRLVTHLATLAGPMVARTTGLPWISTVLAPISMFSEADPPVLVTPLRRLRSKYLNRISKRVVVRWSRGVVQFQEELGQGSEGNPMFEGQHSPRKVLALFSGHFAPMQPDWPPQTVVTGFPFAPRAELPVEIARFLDAGPPPVVFTLGSSAVLTPGRFFDIARQLGQRALLLAGPSAGSIPPSKDVLAVEYAPHSAVFPRASVIVHQGGIGTTAEALRSGKPSLVVPFAHDQPDNGSRLERLGVGRIISRRSLSVKRLRREIDELAACQTAAQNLGQKIAMEDGARSAAHEIAG